MMGTTCTNVCCLTRHIFLSDDQLLKRDPFSSLQVAMTVGDVFLIQNPEFMHP